MKYDMNDKQKKMVLDAIQHAIDSLKEKGGEDYENALLAYDYISLCGEAEEE